MSERTMRSNFPFVQKTGFFGCEWGVRGWEAQGTYAVRALLALETRLTNIFLLYVLVTLHRVLSRAPFHGGWSSTTHIHIHKNQHVVVQSCNGNLWSTMRMCLLNREINIIIIVAIPTQYIFSIFLVPSPSSPIEKTRNTFCIRFLIFLHFSFWWSFRSFVSSWLCAWMMVVRCNMHATYANAWSNIYVGAPHNVNGRRKRMKKSLICFREAMPQWVRTRMPCMYKQFISKTRTTSATVWYIASTKFKYIVGAFYEHVKFVRAHKMFKSKDKANIYLFWDVPRALLLRRKKCVIAWRSVDDGSCSVCTLEAVDKDGRKIRNGNKYLIRFVGCKFVPEVLPVYNYISAGCVDMNWRLSALGYVVCRGMTTNVVRTYCFVNIRVSLDSCAIIIIVILVCFIKRATVSHAMQNFSLQFNAFTYYAWMFRYFLLLFLILYFLLVRCSISWRQKQRYETHITHTISVFFCFPWSRLHIMTRSKWT